MVVDGNVIAHHSFTFFLVASLRIPLEEMPLPLSVHIMVCLLPLPLLVESRGGHMTKALQMRSLNTLVAVTGAGWCLSPAGTVKGIPLSARVVGLVGCEHSAHVSGSGAGREETDLAQAFGSNYTCLLLGFPAPWTSQFLEPTDSF